MKLLLSIRRELLLLSRSIYFYVEVSVAAVALIVLLIVMPEEFNNRVTEYAFFNAPPQMARAMEEAMLESYDNYTVENVILKNRGREINARLYTFDLKYLYVVDSREELAALCEDTGHVGTVAHPPGSVPAAEFYLQGNETSRYQDYALLALHPDTTAILSQAARQQVRSLEENPRILTDRQSVLPMILTINCVLMGILTAAAFIIEDKKTKVIKALRVLPARMEMYLLSKMTAVVLMALITCLIITVPIMKGGANYLLLCLVVISGGFFTVSIGSLLASFFEDIGKAFAAIFIFLIALMIPCILYMMPGINALWIKFIPSYFVVESIKESLLNRDAVYVLLCSAGLIAGGLILMPFSARRYKAAGIGVGG